MKRSYKMVHDGGYVIGERDCGDLTEYFSPFLCFNGNRRKIFRTEKHSKALLCF